MLNFMVLVEQVRWMGVNSMINQSDCYKKKRTGDSAQTYIQ